MLTKTDIDWLKSEFVPTLADAVQKGSEKKLEDLEERVATIEKHLHLPVSP